MRMLEATIAVLIVSGVLVVVYSRQIDRGIDPVEYFESLQGEILDDIAMRSDLRLKVLNMSEDNPTDPDFVVINDYIASRNPDFVEYSISVCELGSDTDFCKMNGTALIATREKEVFVEDLIISADVGSGADAIYQPKKLRLFMWEKYK